MAECNFPSGEITTESSANSITGPCELGCRGEPRGHAYTNKDGIVI